MIPNCACAELSGPLTQDWWAPWAMLFAVVESHPEHVRPDLRLTQPFPELKEFCDSFDLDSMSKKVGATIWVL